MTAHDSIRPPSKPCSESIYGVTQLRQSCGAVWPHLFSFRFLPVPGPVSVGNSANQAQQGYGGGGEECSVHGSLTCRIETHAWSKRDRGHERPSASVTQVLPECSLLTSEGDVASSKPARSQQRVLACLPGRCRYRCAPHELVTQWPRVRLPVCRTLHVHICPYLFNWAGTLQSAHHHPLSTHHRHTQAGGIRERTEGQLSRH